MRLYLLALNPTDSVTQGFLPAAARLGLSVTVLTDSVAEHQRAYQGLEFAPEVVECPVRDHWEVISLISRLDAPAAVFSNSDHLQTQTALAAEYFGLPGKSWQATLRAKNKAELRRHLALAGLDEVWSAELPPGRESAELDPPFPCVVKPREGVASEDVALAADAEELALHCKAIRHRRPGAVLVVEEFLHGELHTLETLGDGHGRRHVLGGFHTRLSPPPQFVEEVLTFVPAHPQPVTDQVLDQLDALGVSFGACHTEFVVQPDGRVRLIEVNYRAIGDQCDLMLAQILAVPYFELVLGAHLGRPLPADLGARTDQRARNEVVCADRAGTLTAAPGPTDLVRDGVRLAYRPLRPIGEHHEHYRTNRDYLGVIWAIGPDQGEVDRTVAEFIAANTWEITP
ncbi:siderophore biosynthesis protein [Kitasatospora sp. MMS16-BH015]|uniref:ATP-grasp domain-containing protein n=1 Tax=Kitasatospora sp. MMS16-BH015 TaxID=2018025 RepID=UPI000CA1C237|nr:ATP-grasp domain-containing protein [Kitasatospora sp. MMS16-BH015]AUG80877.1 siderophore biosynthesis protein [Kitasatospora sp. MMS16-BH015]